MIRLAKVAQPDGVEPKTRQALLALQTATSDAIEALDNAQSIVVKETTGTAPSMAQPGSMVVCREDMVVWFPVPDGDNRAKSIIIVKVGSPTVTLQPISGTIDGSATSSGPSANQARRYVSSGHGWHSVA